MLSESNWYPGRQLQTGCLVTLSRKHICSQTLPVVHAEFAETENIKLHNIMNSLCSKYHCMLTDQIVIQIQADSYIQMIHLC